MIKVKYRGNTCGIFDVLWVCVLITLLLCEIVRVMKVSWVSL